MRYGRLTQTAWQRSVRRELHKRGKDVLSDRRPGRNVPASKMGAAGLSCGQMPILPEILRIPDIMQSCTRAGELAAKGSACSLRICAYSVST